MLTMPSVKEHTTNCLKPPFMAKCFILKSLWVEFSTKVVLNDLSAAQQT